MRVRVEVLLKEKGLILPFDHQYYLASFIYKSIHKSDCAYAADLHTRNKFKHFTFSYVLCKRRKKTREGIKILDDLAYFIVSSPDKEFMKLLINGLLSHSKFRIKHVVGDIQSIKVLRPPKFKNSVVFKTLSPIIVRRGNKEGNGWVSLYPKDEGFTEQLISNLRRRFLDFYGREGRSIRVKVDQFIPKRHLIINTYHRCSHVVMRVEGDMDLIRYGYEAGFGEKNALGFGMVKII